MNFTQDLLVIEDLRRLICNADPAKILIVDDQSFNIDALMIILKYNIGINTNKICEFCFDGLEALALVEKEIEAKKSNVLKKIKYDLILIDCNMPFLDGYEATKRIRQLLHDKSFI